MSSMSLIVLKRHWWEGRNRLGSFIITCTESLWMAGVRRPSCRSVVFITSISLPGTISCFLWVQRSKQCVYGAENVSCSFLQMNVHHYRLQCAKIFGHTHVCISDWRSTDVKSDKSKCIWITAKGVLAGWLSVSDAFILSPSGVTLLDQLFFFESKEIKSPDLLGKRYHRPLRCHKWLISNQL